MDGEEITAGKPGLRNSKRGIEDSPGFVRHSVSIKGLRIPAPRHQLLGQPPNRLVGGRDEDPPEEVVAYEAK